MRSRVRRFRSLFLSLSALATKDGCGGGAGDPGAPATGGGSSIGVFAWNATVTIKGGRIRSGDAGNGGAGGPGGAGGAATNGVAGAASPPCTIGCTFVVGACVPVTGHADGGGAGDAGGRGGVGGAGGGGGGGSSFAIYQGGQALVTTSGGTSLVHGKAGNGGGPDGGAGATGLAADRLP